MPRQYVPRLPQQLRAEPVSARIDSTTRAQLSSAAKKQGLSLSALLRGIINGVRLSEEGLPTLGIVAALAKGAAPTEADITNPDALAKLIDALDLPEDATPEDILNAVKALLADVSADPVAAGPAAPMPDPGTPAKLSVEVQMQVDKMDPVQKANFERYRAAAAHDRAAQTRRRK